MIAIRNSADLAAALASLLDPDLRRLLITRRDQVLKAPDDDLAEHVHFFVVQPGDQLEAIEREAGVPLATNLVDARHWGDADFVPSYESIERHGGWLEATLILTDDGFATVLLVQDRFDTDPRLLRVLRMHV